MRTGRYFFTLLYDGEERDTAHRRAGRQRAGGGDGGGDERERPPRRRLHRRAATTVRAAVRLNQALPNAADRGLRADAVGRLPPDRAPPDHMRLPRGSNALVISGVFTTETAGAHQVIFKVRDAATFAELGGEARYVDVGSATITDLTTDHGVYAPGAPALGEVSLYNADVAVGDGAHVGRGGAPQPGGDGQGPSGPALHSRLQPRRWTRCSSAR
jgi:hypothetical protein